MQIMFRVTGVLVVASALGACSSLPPLTRSVVVQRNVTTPAPTSPTRAPAAAASPAHANGTVNDGTYRVARGDTLYSIAFRAGVDFRQLAAWNGIAAPYVIHPGQSLRLHSPAGSAAPGPRVADAARAPVATNTAPVFQTVPTHAPPPPPPPPPATPSRVVTPTPAPVPATPEQTATTSVASLPASTLSTVVPVAGKPVTATPAPAVVAVTPGKTRSAGGIEWRWPADGPLIARFSAGDAIPGIDIAGKSGDPVRAAADGVVVYSGNGLVGYGELVIIKHNDDYLSAYGHNRKRLVKEGERVRAGQTIAEMGSSGASRDELQFQVRRNGTPVDPLNYLPAR